MLVPNEAKHIDIESRQTCTERIFIRPTTTALRYASLMDGGSWEQRSFFHSVLSKGDRGPRLIKYPLPEVTTKSESTNNGVIMLAFSPDEFEKSSLSKDFICTWFR